MCDQDFRDLNNLLSVSKSSSDSYIIHFKHHLGAIQPGLWEHLDRTPNLDPAASFEVVSFLLELACQAQNNLNIELGRAGLLALPRAWLLENILMIAHAQLNLHDDWEYRRLLEVAWKLDGGLVKRLTELGLSSENAGVREVAEDSWNELDESLASTENGSNREEHLEGRMGIIDNGMLWRQFAIAIDSLEAALRGCPDQLWEARLWADQPDQWVAKGFSSFWYLGYHTLFWLDLYLTGAEEGFAPPEPFDLVEMEANEALPRTYTREELLGYLKLCRQRCQDAIGALTPEQASRICRFPWGEVPYGELMLYSMRHVQEHAAQLHLFLGQQAQQSAS